MLVITRKLGQVTHFLLPDGQKMSIRVHRIEVGQKKIRLAIDAAENVTVVRDDAIKGSRKPGPRYVPALPTDSDCETDA